MERKVENVGEVSGSLTTERMAWTAAECARAIGRSTHAVYCLVNRRAIPFHKPDGRLQFIPDEVKAWLKTGAKNVS